MSSTEYTLNPEAWNKFVRGICPLIDPEFMEASDHPGSCRCDKCLKWWVKMGPDDNEKYGPFTKAEIMAARGKGVEDEVSLEIDDDA